MVKKVEKEVEGPKIEYAADWAFAKQKSRFDFDALVQSGILDYKDEMTEEEFDKIWNENFKEDEK